MRRPPTLSLPVLALLAGIVAPALAQDATGDAPLPRNEKTEAISADKTFGKQASIALPVVAMAVRPVPATPPPATPAPTPTPARKLTGTGELGFAAASGNSNTESFNGRLDLTYTDGGPWRHSASLFGLHSRSEYRKTQADGSIVRDRRTTANRYTLNANSAYLMDERGTLNTSLRHEEDDFGNRRQQSLSLSYGNRVIESERTHLDLQVGPGYRRAYDSIDERTEASFIGRGLIDLRYALSENTEIVNKLLIESGEYNTFAQNDLGVSVTMNSHLALKAGWQARHNSDVAPDIKKTDTLTTMNVVYRFK